MGRGPGADLAALLRRAAARRREPEGYAGARAALLRPGNPAARAARRAYAGGRPRQLAARADHGAGEADAGTDPQARTRDRRAGDLPAERGFDGGIEGRSGGIICRLVVGWVEPFAKPIGHAGRKRWVSQRAQPI